MNRHGFRRLDSAAHIFPLITNRDYSNVFRVAAVLKNPINPSCLQKAVTMTLEAYPHFQSKIAKGVFWYYFEPNHTKGFHVEEEKLRPCSYIDLPENRDYLFRVLYYDKRISLEVFHVLTDGHGALAFLKALVKNYEGVLEAMDGSYDWVAFAPSPMSKSAKMEAVDSYKDHYQKTMGRGHAPEKAYEVCGDKLPRYTMSLFQVIISKESLARVAKKAHLTITMLLCAIYLYSIYVSEGLPLKKHRPIKVAIPVNLRPFFDSHTLMNFFSYITVTLKHSEAPISFEAIAQLVRHTFLEEINKTNFTNKLSEDVERSQHWFVRIAPRPLKYLFVKQLYTRSMKAYTTTLSNLGSVSEDLGEEGVDHYELLLNPTKTSPIKMGVAGFGDQICVSMTSQLKDSRLDQVFLETLTTQGIAYSLEGSKYPDNIMTQREYRLLYRVLTLISVIFILSSIIGNLFIYKGTYWSVLSLLVVAYSWVLTRHIVVHGRELATKIVFQALIMALSVYVFDIVLGYKGWSLTYVIPQILIGSWLALMVLVALSKFKWEKYVLQQLWMLVCATTLLLSWALAFVDKPLFVFLAAGLNYGGLILALSHGRNKVLSELKKRFHV